VKPRADEAAYVVLEQKGAVPVKAWVRGVPFDAGARAQLLKAAHLPFIHRWIAAMPDVHVGIGATVGSVIPTIGAIVPAAVGVDIGCGMMAVRTSLRAADLPDSLHGLRVAIEGAVPHGRTHEGRRNDRGAWSHPPQEVVAAFEDLAPGYASLISKHPDLDRANHPLVHLGTLGTGNHFIEVSLDEAQAVWIVLHSGSRGVGNRIGTHFIEVAKEEARRRGVDLPEKDLAWLEDGTESFRDYLEAVDWAQRFAFRNREVMMEAILGALSECGELPSFTFRLEVVNCHHNYVAREHHYGKDVWLTRKGAVRARKGDLGIIPGSMGARSFIVRGKGNPESFDSCSHGAGRAFSRTEAKRTFTVEQHAEATAGVECRKDASVLDETPGAYKPIDAVMRAQADLVEIVHTLKQVVCVKG
jgi:tRNA-splicing ligase RtcB